MKILANMKEYYCHCYNLIFPTFFFLENKNFYFFCIYNNIKIKKN